MFIFICGFSVKVTSAMFIRSNEETLNDNGIFDGFKGTVVNRALPPLHGGSFEITLTVPLIPQAIPLQGYYK